MVPRVVVAIVFLLAWETGSVSFSHALPRPEGAVTATVVLPEAWGPPSFDSTVEKKPEARPGPLLPLRTSPEAPPAMQETGKRTDRLVRRTSYRPRRRLAKPRPGDDVPD
ncbi:MAG: hypothetical protein KatS3mg076_1554 [Candidatus Binatia bacterium]|nr:MAG: hypothetical protein KatS3mg076_1554 [Candidatus Binatia bacterium]